jgi:16S rRNA (guanine966-N2)-methyltransferase
MRIIAGRFRGRILSSPSGRDTRPTSARARGALFEILKDQLEDAYVADLFAGTGALGLEALSRGARRVDFYESHRAALACLRDNIDSLDVRNATRVVSAPLPDSLTRGDRYDLVFMDPPWREGHELRVSRKLVTQARLAEHGLLVIESPRDEPLEETLWDELGLTLTDKRNYGDTELRFFSPKTAPVDPQ